MFWRFVVCQAFPSLALAQLELGYRQSGRKSGSVMSVLVLHSQTSLRFDSEDRCNRYLALLVLGFWGVL